MQQRIDHLEALVKRLSRQHQSSAAVNAIFSQKSPNPGVSDTPGVECSAGTTIIDGDLSVL